MKRIFYMALPLLMLGALSSCDEKSRLASEIEGTWTGAPEQMTVTDAASSSATRVITFTKGDKNMPSTMSVDAMFSVEIALPATDGIVTPIAVTASGTAVIAGTWQPVDDDEIAVFLDRSTLEVSVDPDAVTLTASPLFASQSQVDSLKPAMTQAVKQHITSAMEHSVLDFNRIDDIKIKNNILSCEIGKKDLTFHRSGN